MMLGSTTSRLYAMCEEGDAKKRGGTAASVAFCELESVLYADRAGLDCFPPLCGVSRASNTLESVLGSAHLRLGMLGTEAWSAQLLDRRLPPGR